MTLGELTVSIWWMTSTERWVQRKRLWSMSSTSIMWGLCVAACSSWDTVSTVSARASRSAAPGLPLTSSLDRRLIFSSSLTPNAKAWPSI